jgi:uncharacterized protein YutE (UPF0331/DUF86 family)
VATPEELRWQHLKEQLQLAEKAAKALQFSYDRAEFIPLHSDRAVTPEQAERLEALSARFARLSDILVQKIFRAIDAIELVDEGSLLDRLARMEKRRVIESTETWRVIREVRNQIAHDYVLKDLHTLYNQVYRHTPVLLETLSRVQQGYAPNTHSS